MDVLINGEPQEVPEGTTVASVLARLELPPRGIAVALDREVVPDWL